MSPPPTKEKGLMGIKVQGSMWCDTHGLIAAQKSTHRLRNTVAVAAVPLTGGLSVAGTGVGHWHCPHCGSPAYQARVNADGTVDARKPMTDAEVRAAVRGGWQGICSIGCMIERFFVRRSR